MSKRKSTRYDQGSVFERFVIKKLKENQYFPIRSAGSKSPVDIIATHPLSPTMFIQCKSSQVETMPDLRELLREKVYKDERQKSVKIGDVRMPLPKERKLVKSNVKLLEELESSHPVQKVIFWKGKGTKNYFRLDYVNGKWTCERVFQII